jgi:glutathione S-transferase
LFGRFSHADAVFAPIASRFVTYAPELPSDVRDYVATLHELPAMATWIAAARAEHDFVVIDEPYRRG